MPYMELRSTFGTCFFLFLILALPFSSTAGSQVLDSSEVYEIDYRGPETHSSVPPPGHSHGNSHSSAHRKISVDGEATAKKGFMATNHKQEKGKKNIHE